MKKFFLLCCVTVLLISCDATKKAARKTTPEDLTTLSLINRHYDNAVDFETLSARLKVAYKDKKRSQNVSVTLRMEKDKVIWVNASLLGITLARAKITPEKVAFFEKLNGRYFEGDFEFLSQYFGVALDFDQLQRLIIGQTVYDLREGNYKRKDEANTYALTPKVQPEIADLFFFINNKTLNLKQQRVIQVEQQVALDVTYKDFSTINGKYFPESFLIKAQKKGDKTTIDVEFRGLKFDEEGLRFPFTIPEGYKEMRL